MKKPNFPKPLTTDNLFQLKGALDTLRSQYAELDAAVQSLPPKGRDILWGRDLWWAWCYELSIYQHFALYLHVMGLLDQLMPVFRKAKDKNKAVLDFALSYRPDEKYGRKEIAFFREQ